AAAGNVILAGGQEFGSLAVTGSGAWAAQDALLLRGSFSQTTGSFMAPPSVFTILGALNRSGGTFLHNSGTTVFATPANRTLTSAAATFKHVVVNDGLLGYWPLDEAAGPVAADASGSGNHGTHVGAPTVSAAVPPTVAFPDPACLVFDGASRYVDI